MFKPTKTWTDEEYQEALAKAYKQGGSLGRLRRGRWEDIESLADEMLRQSLTGVTRYQDKADILTPWKTQMRQKREVFTSSGFPDASIRRGMYKRAANPLKLDLNSRDGIARPRTKGINYTNDSYYGHRDYSDE